MATNTLINGGKGLNLFKVRHGEKGETRERERKR